MGAERTDVYFPLIQGKNVALLSNHTGVAALLAFVAINGGRDLNHRRSIDPGSRNSAPEPKVRKDLRFNPWDGVADNKKD